MGHAGGGGQQLRIGGGHGGGQDARQHHAGQQRRQDAIGAHQRRNAYQNGLSSGVAGKGGDDALVAHGKAHQADDDGDAHGDDHPDRADAAGDLELLTVLDGHEVVQDMGHAEVAEAPGHRGHDGNKAVLAGLRALDRGIGKEAQIAGHGFGVFHDRTPAADRVNAEDEDHKEGDRHHDGLDQARDRGSQETAHGAVADDDRRGDQHGAQIVHVGEEVGKELAAGREAGSGVGDKEDDDDQRRNALDQTALVAEAMGEKVGDRDRAQLLGIAAQALGHDQPVQVGAKRKADHRPGGVSKAAEISQTGHAHQQPAAHVRGLRAHGNDHGAQLAAAQIEIAGGLVAFGVDRADRQHADQVDGDGQDDADVCACHGVSPLLPGMPVF